MAKLTSLQQTTHNLRQRLNEYDVFLKTGHSKFTDDGMGHPESATPRAICGPAKAPDRDAAYAPGDRQPLRTAADRDLRRAAAEGSKSELSK